MTLTSDLEKCVLGASAPCTDEETEAGETPQLVRGKTTASWVLPTSSASLPSPPPLLGSRSCWMALPEHAQMAHLLHTAWAVGLQLPFTTFFFHASPLHSVHLFNVPTNGLGTPKRNILIQVVSGGAQHSTCLRRPLEAPLWVTLCTSSLQWAVGSPRPRSPWLCCVQPQCPLPRSGFIRSCP